MSQAITPKWVKDVHYCENQGALSSNVLIFGVMGTAQESGAVQAVRLRDGSDVWSLQTVGSAMSVVLVEGGLAYATAIFSVTTAGVRQEKVSIYAIDVATGLPRWRVVLDGWAKMLLLKTEGLIAFASREMTPAPHDDNDIHFFATLLDKQTGVTKDVLDLGPGFPVAAVWNNQIAIVHHNRPWIDILDPATWTLSRKYTAPQPIQQACFEDGRCYAALSAEFEGASTLISVDLATGAPGWSQPQNMRIVDLLAQGRNLVMSARPTPGDTGTPHFISLMDIDSGIPMWTSPAGTAAPQIGPIIGGKAIAQLRYRPAKVTTAVTVAYDLETGAEIFHCEFPYSAGWTLDAGDGVLVSSHLDKLFALDLNRFWTAAYGGNVRGTPATTSDGVVIGNADGRLIYAATVDGGVRWTARLTTPVEGAPFLSGNRVYCGHGGGVSAVDMAAGTVVWTCGTQQPVAGPVMVYGQTVVFGGRDEMIHAAAAADGHLLWTLQTGGFVEGGVAFDGVAYYAGSADGSLYAIAPDGHLRWTFTPPGAEIEEFKAMPLVTHGLVIAGNGAGYVYALNATTGAVTWKIRLGGSVKGCAPLLHTEHFWIASEQGHVCRIAIADGVTVWDSDVHGAVLSQPLWRNSSLYVGTRAGTVAVLDIWTGAIRRTVQVAGPVTASAVVAGSAVLVTSENGTMTSLIP
jgi:outer membrane protein assembly factor BamB